MFWQDLLLDRVVDSTTLGAAVARLMGLEPKQVLVTPSIADAAWPANVKVVVEATRRPGEFLYRLSIFLYDSALEASPEDFVRGLCTEIQVRCLMSDDSANPYSMLLVDDSGELRQVWLDPERLDDHDEYVIKQPAG